MAVIESIPLHAMERTGNTQYYSERLETTGEAAVLYAAGFRHPAMQMLRRECEHLGAEAGPKAWAMLFEACHLLGERAEFDRLCEVYRGSFRCARAPRWGYAAAVHAPGTVRLEGTLASMDDLRPLVESAKGKSTIAIDFSRVERIDFTFAPVLCALLRTYGMQSKRIILANIAELHAELVQSMGTGSHVALMRRRILEADPARANAASNDDSAAAALAAA
jgi:ABC-type transporter Mla MlaB component